MKRILIIGLIALSLILTSCAGFKPNDEALLRAELKKWESFTGDGIIELSAFGFSLRKPFSLAKSAKQMRLDVIEGGIFGANASPLISMYLGDYFAMAAPAMPALEALNLKDKIPFGTLALFSSADYLFDKYGAEIIREKAIVRDSLTINFSPKYKLESVTDRKSGANVTLSYTNRGDLDKLEIKAGQVVSAKLLFDDVKYQVPSILPLPEGTATQQNIMELLKDEGMFQMFKGLLGN
ncbi:MAG: hypothetical protein M0Q16_00300 [Candidatus Cloacimonetes bacterium]|jgi:hypothetical protein|nr:hypothetical protein [Candidatus Cloacimonadota bacterium]MCK9183800.1 hypothetical protein [Candidatus Cloacimonadota bacterium]MCK9584909.1 hypothetical protein [Candidatus Cloacimonadota bacterium]